MQSTSTISESWKSTIVNQLYERFEHEMEPFKNGRYNKAIENGTWRKTASCYLMCNEIKVQELINQDFEVNSLQNSFVNQVNSYLYSSNSVVGPAYQKNDFIKCHLELNRVGSFSSTESGTLTFKYQNQGKKGRVSYKTNIINLAEIICITSSSNIINYPLPNVLFIYLTKYTFIFSFDEESELNDWCVNLLFKCIELLLISIISFYRFASLNVSCNNLNNFQDTVFSPFYKPSIFLVSTFGQQAYAGYVLSDRSIQSKRNKLKYKLDKIKSDKQNLKYKLHKLKASDNLNEQSSPELNDLNEHEIEKTLEELKSEENAARKSLEDLLMKSSQQCTDQEERLYFLHLGGGSFKAIEFTSTGIVWSISQNGTPYIHNNLIGGSVYKHLLSNNNLNFITDTITYTTYENQRYVPFAGFQSRLLPTDRHLWSDESGLIELNKEDIKLPSSEYKWLNQWKYYCDSSTDEDGWEYSVDFSVEFHSQKRVSDLVRRRKWSRLAKLSTTGKN